MNTIVQELNPTGTLDVRLTPDNDGFVYPLAIERVGNEFNQTPYRQLIALLDNKVRRDHNTGMEYAIWNGDQGSQLEYSQTDAVVMFNTFATRVDHNMLLRGEFCHRVFNYLDLRDNAGKKLPLIFFSAPTGDAEWQLTRSQQKLISKGDLGPAAAEQLKYIRTMGFGRAALIGYSQGGSMAGAGARVAYSLGLDITHVGAASIPNTFKRFPVSLQLDFASQAKYLRPDIAKGGIEAFEKVHELEYNEWIYLKAMCSQMAVNFALFCGMSKASFEDDMAAAYYKNPDLRLSMAVATGNLDRVAREKQTGRVIHDLRLVADSLKAPQPHHIIVENGRHSWGDRVKLLAAFYSYSLSLNR